MASSISQGVGVDVPAESGAGYGWRGFAGQFCEEFAIDNQMDVSSDANVDLPDQLPAGAIVQWVQIQCVSATATYSTATGIGVGTGVDPDQFGEWALTGLDAKNDQNGSAVSNVRFASATTAKIFATNGSGTAAGTLDTGTYRVRIGGIIPKAIPDVA